LFALLHIIEKRCGKVPREDIEIAQGRWEDFRARMDACIAVPLATSAGMPGSELQMFARQSRALYQS
jgi:hypothetical protein